MQKCAIFPSGSPRSPCLPSSPYRISIKLCSMTLGSTRMYVYSIQFLHRSRDETHPWMAGPRAAQSRRKHLTYTWYVRCFCFLLFFFAFLQNTKVYILFVIFIILLKCQPLWNHLFSLNNNVKNSIACF